MRTSTSAKAVVLALCCLFLLGLPAVADGAVSIESVTVAQDDVGVMVSNADVQDRGVMLQVTAELVGGDVVTQYRFVYTQAQSLGLTNVQFEKKVRELIIVGLVDGADPMPE